MSAFVLALVLGLAPVGIEQAAAAGPVSVDVGDEIDVQAGPAGLQASADGVGLQAPLLDPLQVSTQLGVLGGTEDAAPRNDGASSSSSGVSAALQTPTAKVVAGTSATALLLGIAVWLARAAGLIPWFSSFSRIEDDKLADHPTRRLALDFIASNPGATLQDVRRGLGIAWGTTVHHLGRLERAGLVAVRHIGGKRSHWPLGQAPARDALPESGRALAALVRDNPGLPQKDLARLAGLQAPAACKQLARLEAAGLVSAQRIGKGRHYLPTASLLSAPPALVPVALVKALTMPTMTMPSPLAIPA